MNVTSVAGTGQRSVEQLALYGRGVEVVIVCMLTQPADSPANIVELTGKRVLPNPLPRTATPATA
jgi:hypothetical protein